MRGGWPKTASWLPRCRPRGSREKPWQWRHMQRVTCTNDLLLCSIYELVSAGSQCAHRLAGVPKLPSTSRRARIRYTCNQVPARTCLETINAEVASDMYLLHNCENANHGAAPGQLSPTCQGALGLAGSWSISASICLEADLAACMRRSAASAAASLSAGPASPEPGSVSRERLARWLSRRAGANGGSAAPAQGRSRELSIGRLSRAVIGWREASRACSKRAASSAVTAGAAAGKRGGRA